MGGSRALVLLSPWVELEMPGASFASNDDADFGTREELLRHARAVASTTPLCELALEARDLPPTFVCEAEIPRDDILGFAEKLRRAGVPTTLQVALDMPHDALLFAAQHAAALAAFRETVRFLRTL